MKAALKRKWIAALRSGKYKQGDGALRAEQADGEERWCCLGVLASVAGCRWKERYAVFSLSGEFKANTPMGNWFIPDRIAKRIGIGVAGEEDEKTPQRILANKNDQPESFGEIATWIEKNL